MTNEQRDPAVAGKTIRFGITGQIAHGDTRTLHSMTSTSFVKQDWERSCLV